MSYQCPNCKCYTIKTVEQGGSATISYARCLNIEGSWQIFYEEITPLEQQVLYICAVQDSISAPPGTIIIPTGSECTIDSSCAIPDAYCYTVSLASGTVATFTYIVPFDELGQPNMIKYGSVSTMMGTSVIVCARQGSIVQTSGGSISISAPSETTCDTNLDCNPFFQRCIITNISYPPPFTQPMMEDFQPPYVDNTFVLLDFTVNGTQYATGQTLIVNSITNPPVFGTGQDGLTYPMNVSDWINSIGAPGISFYDNMSVADYMSNTVYTIHIQKQWDPGQSANYYFSSDYGFAINTETFTYGTQTCEPYAP